MFRLEVMAERTPAALVQVGVRFGRALLADESEADGLYDGGLNADPKWPLDYAWLEVAHGAWLRRRRRITESRPHLRAARDAFDALRLPHGPTKRERSYALQASARRSRPGRPASTLATGATDRPDGGVGPFQP